MQNQLEVVIIHATKMLISAAGLGQRLSIFKDGLVFYITVLRISYCTL